MDKEEQKRIKQQFLEEQERAYDAEPDVKNWIKTKETIYKVLAAYWLVHAVLCIAALLQAQAGLNFITDILKPVFQLFWLYVFISPKNTWRVNTALYFAAFYNFVMNLNHYFHLRGYLWETVRLSPVTGIVFLMDALVPFLFLITACYLTIPKAHRDLSDRAKELQTEIMERAKELYK